MADVVDRCGRGIMSHFMLGLPVSYRRRLLSFLETSRLYTPQTLLSHFPPGELFEERAILLGKLGQVSCVVWYTHGPRFDHRHLWSSYSQHEAALRVYAHNLKDDAMAAQYCEDVYLSCVLGGLFMFAVCCAELTPLCANSGDRDGKDVYVTLLKAYLRPPTRRSSSFGGSSAGGSGMYASDGDDDAWGPTGRTGASNGVHDSEGRMLPDFMERTAAVVRTLASNVGRLNTTRVVEVSCLLG